MEKIYVIVSLKHSDNEGVCFWRANDAGYTINPWQAGLYTHAQVKANPEYYNDGHNTVAVCINNSSLPLSGVKIKLNEATLKKYRKENKSEL